MAIEYTFEDMQAEELLAWVTERSRNGWRFVQLCATQCEQGADLMYTLRNGSAVESRTIHGVGQDDHIPSITEIYLEAFVFENEAHDLFGLQIDGIAIDFQGKFYRLSIDKPMTIVSPEKQERIEKARKAAAAKAAKAAKEKAAKEAAAAAEAAPAEAAPATTPAEAAPAGEIDAALEAKLAAMPPEKAEKVRAAMAAKAAKAAASKEPASEAGKEVAQ